MRGILESRGVSQAELCRRTGLDKDTVRRLLSGDRIGMLDTWMRIFDALGIEPNDVLGVSGGCDPGRSVTSRSH